ncbi:hypothetical protein FA13DRAFT_1905986 [Coprinellus micaceus]|uniref:Uncharacterized protein n=1 Tax=Coprinellus micaceus TaxID=71717 RepID=A0A4Y7SSH7_COPMI|nr:hypothetical protein FA13DRAFT_1905986 [Coprinellus micaceus]
MVMGGISSFGMACLHTSLTSFQTRSWPEALHCSKICSMVSISTPQILHGICCSVSLGIILQNFPILCSWCIVFHKKTLTFFAITLCLFWDHQTSSSLGRFPLISSITFWMWPIFSDVAWHPSRAFFCFTPL